MCAEAPNVLPEPFGRDAGPDFVDLARAIAMRNDARVRHTDAEGIAPFFDVAGVDAGSGLADSDFSRAGMRV